MSAFHKGLDESGYIGGENVTIESSWAEGQFDRLPALAADLVRRQVSVMVTNTPPGVLAAKSQTAPKAAKKPAAAKKDKPKAKPKAKKG